MQEQSRLRLAAALSVALGLVAHGSVNAATNEQPKMSRSASASLIADAPDSSQLQSSTDAKKSKKGQTKVKDTKGKEGSCKGKEGSCKGKEGSCKGKEGSCKGKEGSCKGKDKDSQAPGTGTGY